MYVVNCMSALRLAPVQTCRRLCSSTAGSKKTEGNDGAFRPTQSSAERSTEKISMGGGQKPFGLRWSYVIPALVVGGGAVFVFNHFKNEKLVAQERERRKQVGKSLVGGPWALKDNNGRWRKSTDFHGRWLLMYFGFTHCPDVCPEELDKLAEVLEYFDKKQASLPQVQGVFISVDPVRDTEPMIKKYLAEFTPHMLGFTGTVEQIEEVCRTFRVYKSQGPKDKFADYLMDHTIVVYLLDPEGNFVEYFGQKTSANYIVTSVKRAMRKYELLKAREKSLVERVTSAMGGSSSTEGKTEEEQTQVGEEKKT